MGCNNSRKGISDEEAALRSQEAMLLYSNQTVTANYLALCRYSRGQELNAEALDQAFSKMLVIKGNLGSSNTITDFYESFRKQPGVYDAKLLKVLCVLLGKGSTVEKATLLFEIYDPGFAETLERAKIAEMVEDLVDISAQKVSVLVTDSQYRHSGQLTNQQYLKGLFTQAGKAQDSFKKLVLRGGERVTKEDFVSILQEPDNTGWLSSSGIRKILNAFSLERLAVRKHGQVSLTRPTLRKPASLTSPS